MLVLCCAAVLAGCSKKDDPADKKPPAIFVAPFDCNNVVEILTIKYSPIGITHLAFLPLLFIQKLYCSNHL